MVVDIHNTDKKYSIIYADPPWAYKCWSPKGTGRSAESHYNTMSVDDICNFPINNITDKDCTLFMWVTMPKLEECFKVIKMWGFTYKTCAFTWIKLNKRKQSLFFGEWGDGHVLIPKYVY